MIKLHQEVMKRKENLFFAEMQLDMEIGEQWKWFYEQEKLKVQVQRRFILEVKK